MSSTLSYLRNPHRNRKLSTTTMSSDTTTSTTVTTTSDSLYYTSDNVNIPRSCLIPPSSNIPQSSPTTTLSPAIATPTSITMLSSSSSASSILSNVALPNSSWTQESHTASLQNHQQQPEQQQQQQQQQQKPSATSLASLLSSSSASAPPTRRTSTTVDNNVITSDGGYKFGNGGSMNNNTNSRKSSRSSNYSNCHTAFQDFQDVWLFRFNKGLKNYFDIDTNNSNMVGEDQVFVINTVAQLNRLLYFNYHQKLGFDYEYSDKLFPYLHGLNDRDQQIHFVKETGKSVDKINHQLENLTINNFMFINATTDKKNIPNLINTMNIEDLVPSRSQYSNKKDHEYYYSNSGNKISCRNFGQQIELMAPLSHMVVYNYNSCTDNKSNSVDNTKILVNKLLSYMKSSGNRFIYIIDIECEHQSSTTNLANSNSNPCTPWWQSIDQSYFDNDSDELHWYNNAIINQIIKSPQTKNNNGDKVTNNSTDEVFISQGDRFFNKFHRLEQNLIWKMYGKHWILNNKVCVGNILDFHQIQEKNDNQFKLVIYCEDYQNEECYDEFPTLQDLQYIWQDYMLGNHIHHTYMIKIPSLGFRNNKSIDEYELIMILNLLKLIERISRVNKVFIGCYDGFTHSTNLLVLVMQLLGKVIIEESIFQLTETENVKLFFSNPGIVGGDLQFLRELEPFVDYLNKHLIQEFPTIIDMNNLDLDSIHRYYCINPIAKPPLYQDDWFVAKTNNSKHDINLPARILPNVYLGSSMHGGSLTILQAYKLTHLISIDELPNWWHTLKKYYKFDFQLQDEDKDENNHGKNKSNYKIIKPIYTFNNSKSKIYEFEFNLKNLKSIPQELLNKWSSSSSSSMGLPHKNFKSLIYIHDFKDDGRDSLMELLIDAPPAIQDKILLGSTTNINNPTNNYTNANNNNNKTLIHCKIGVSRSATLVIAHLMKTHRLGFLQSYFLVRVQRFNIIIQPNLKLFYELYLFDQWLGLKDFYINHQFKHYNWETICHLINQLNQIYINPKSITLSSS